MIIAMIIIYQWWVMMIDNDDNSDDNADDNDYKNNDKNNHDR